MANCSDPDAPFPSPSTCPIVGFYSAEQRVEILCPDGSITPGAVGLAPYGRVFSLVSQEDADEQALAYAEQLAEIARAGAPCIFLNDVISYTAECPDPASETSTATIPAGTYESEISKADANAIALQAAIDQAEATLSCLFPNSEQTYEAECPDGTSGSPVSVTIDAASYFSYASQAEANAKALAAAQAQAQALLVCVWENEEVSYTASCATGQVGADSEYTVEAGEFTSLASQEDANAQAILYAQVQAEAGLECVWENVEQEFTADCPGSIDGDVISPTGAQIGDSVTVVVLAGEYTSTISQADADAKALAAAEEEASAELECLWANDAQTFIAYCPEGYFGEPVVYTVPVATFTSDVSFADANEQATEEAQEQAEDEIVCNLCPTTLPSVQYDSAEATLNKCGYAEFTSPSSPPKIYSVLDTTGTEAYAQFGGTGCDPDVRNPSETGVFTGHSVYDTPDCTPVGNINIHSIEYQDCTGEPTGEHDTEFAPFPFPGATSATKTTQQFVAGPISNPSVSYEQNVTQTLSVEYTTPALIGYVQDDIPAFDNDWNDTAGSERDLPTNELSYLERHAKARVPLAGVSLVNGAKYRLYYFVRFTPETGPVVDTPDFFEFIYDGSMSYTDELLLPVPDTNGVTTLVLDGWDCGPF